MPVTETNFGWLSSGEPVTKLELKNCSSACLEVMDYGATVVALKIPDSKGVLCDVVLGFDDIVGYQSAQNPYMGCIVGRVSNRVDNGRFTLDGVEYQLTQNEGNYCLHGGNQGFDKKMWKIIDSNQTANACTLQYVSRDGEEGFPGTLETTVTYCLTDQNQLIVEINATTDRATPVSVTNHSYFNLSGQQSGSLKDHCMTIFSSKYLPTNDTHLTTGEITHVDKTLFDLRQETDLLERLSLFSDGGFDNYFCCDSAECFASLRSAVTGIQMNVKTNQPGAQIYTADYVDVVGKNGKHYGKRSGICLETHGYPDAVNKPHFPSIVLRPTEAYRHVTAFEFETLPTLSPLHL